MKRAKATKVDVHYIETNPENMSPDDLSKTLELRLSVVNEILQNKPKSAVTTVKSQTQFEKTIGRHTRKGVAVMTEAASQVIDETRVAHKGKDTSSFVCKVKPD